MVIKVRRNEAVRPLSALICSGVNAEGFRATLGVKLGDSESFTRWDDTFSWLKACGASPAWTAWSRMPTAGCSRRWKSTQNLL